MPTSISIPHSPESETCVKKFLSMAAATALPLLDSIVIAAACQTLRLHCKGLSIASEYHIPVAQDTT